ncbi:hypothetical protein FF38_12257 [Lucilia cuprina]|uniref:F-box domain-containing protein n=1 Tax=Lucilia cuprina TaxID=7375 RepID=A0A0L0CUB2_LUCCU|nr:hypothetical protein CVS40_9841 [Lucilia cuprina]KNC34949.1 hypothetical protein FF38_12257 [Lucilia cuprina]
MMEELHNKEDNTISNNSANITDLNDDCLECIFERIHDLPNQIQIAKSCRRFRNIIVDLWKRQPEYKILAFNELPTVLPNYEDFEYFLKAMKCEFHTLRIIDECLNVFLKEMEECGIDCFTAIERCEFQDDIMDCYPQDEDMELLTKLVPNLKYLHITVPITGHYLTNLKYLEELHLYDEQTKVYEMKEKYLKDILLNLKYLKVLDMRTFEVSHLQLMPEISECLNLQELKLNLNSLKPVLEQVLKLPRLKHLQVLLDQDIDISRLQNIDTFDYKIYETKEYYHILREKGSLLQGLAIDFHFLPVSDTWLTDFHYLNPSNLKLLALCNYDFKSHEECLCCPFNRLEILCLRHAQNLEAVMILDILHLCPKLKHLDISYCLNLDASLLDSLAKYLQKEKRSNALCVYYRMSGLEDEIEKNFAFWTSQKYLQLRNDFPPGSDVGLSYVQRGFAFYF